MVANIQREFLHTPSSSSGICGTGNYAEVRVDFLITGYILKCHLMFYLYFYVQYIYGIGNFIYS